MSAHACFTTGTSRIGVYADSWIQENASQDGCLSGLAGESSLAFMTEQDGRELGSTTRGDDALE